MELARFAPSFVITKAIKKTRFFDGLHFKYQKLMGTYRTFQEMYEHDVEKEIICKREEEVTRKRSGNGQGGNHKRQRFDGNSKVN